MSEQLYNLEQISALADGNEDFINKMIEVFVTQTPTMLEDIKSGVSEQDWEKVRAASHKLKPSIDMMGISEMSPVVRQIEGNAKTQTNLDEFPQLSDEFTNVVYRAIEQLQNR
jgi:HPt (histidine-containing phosphotransfer) domain-containing protein